MTKTPIAFWYRAGLAGLGWSSLATLLEASQEGGWAIRWRDPLALAAALGAGVVTGLVIARLFRRLLHPAVRPLDLALPLLTLPVALATFGLLVWVERVARGELFYRGEPLRDLALIVSTYVFYGLLSIVGPVLYVLAVVTQRLVGSPLAEAKA